MVKKRRVLTPHADYCLPGITRATVSNFPANSRPLHIELRKLPITDHFWPLEMSQPSLCTSLFYKCV
jgi:hypothetical protein